MLVYLRDGSAQTVMHVHTEIEVADQTFSLTQSQCTCTGPTSPSADHITPGAWQVSHCSASFLVTGITRPGKIPSVQAGIEPQILSSQGRRLNHLASEVVSSKDCQLQFCKIALCCIFYPCIFTVMEKGEKARL